MDQKAFNGWILFFTILGCGFAGYSAWCDYQQLKISRQQLG